MSSQHLQLPALTGLRGIAALLVVVSHLNGLAYTTPAPLHLGELGVMVFFALSGFLMALIYLEQSFTRRTASRYAESRLARIAPAYLFIVLAGYLIHRFVDHAFVYELNDGNIVRHLLFLGSQAVFWSVPPEIQFYGLFVFIWFALDAFLRDRRWVWIVAAALACSAMLLTREHVPGTFVGASLHFFLAGALAGRVRALARGRSISLSMLVILQWVPLAWFGLLCSGMLDFSFQTNREVYAHLPNAIGAALTIFVYSYSTAWTRATLEQPLLARCGECSFSIYLLHEPVIYWSRPLASSINLGLFTAFVLVAVVVAAYTTYRVVEIPGRDAIRWLFARLTLASRPPRPNPQS